MNIARGYFKIAKPLTSSTLANLMLDLTRVRATLHAINKAFHRFAPHFTEEAWAKRLVEILEEVSG